MRPDSVVFTYVVPFVGVLLVAVGIAAAVPGAYGLIQAEISPCDQPTIAVETAEQTQRHFGDDPRPRLARFDFEELAPAEQTAFEAALDDARNEAHVSGDFPHGPAFRNGSLVTYQGQRHYVTVVSENPCLQIVPLQFPLGVFAIALGIVGILTPPAYRWLVALEEGLGAE